MMYVQHGTALYINRKGNIQSMSETKRNKIKKNNNFKSKQGSTVFQKRRAMSTAETRGKYRLPHCAAAFYLLCNFLRLRAPTFNLNYAAHSRSLLFSPTETHTLARG